MSVISTLKSPGRRLKLEGSLGYLINSVSKVGGVSEKRGEGGRTGGKDREKGSL